MILLFMRQIGCRLLLLITAAITSGCATVSADGHGLQADDVVGIINVVPSRVTHVHFGTTVFNDFVEDYDSPFDFPRFIEAELAKMIRQETPFRPVVLDVPASVRLHHDNILVRGLTDHINEGVLEDLTRLAHDHGVKIFLIATSVAEDPVGYGGSRKARNYGLFTRSFAGVDRVLAFSTIRFIRVDARNNEFLRPFNRMGASRSTIEVPELQYPADLHSIPSENLVLLERPLRSLMTTRMADAISLLR